MHSFEELSTPILIDTKAGLDSRITAQRIRVAAEKQKLAEFKKTRSQVNKCLSARRCYQSRCPKPVMRDGLVRYKLPAFIDFQDLVLPYCKQDYTLYYNKPGSCILDPVLFIRIPRRVPYDRICLICGTTKVPTIGRWMLHIRSVKKAIVLLREFGVEYLDSIHYTLYGSGKVLRSFDRVWVGARYGGVKTS